MTTTRGLVRKSDLEIGFSPAWELWLVWRLAGHGMGTAGFRRFWIGVVCDRCRIVCFHGPIRRSDIEIGFGPGGTLESMCALLCDRPVIINEP